MAIDPEIEEVLGALIDTVEERIVELKGLAGEHNSTIQSLEMRMEALARSGVQGGGGGQGAAKAELDALNAHLSQIDKRLQALQTQQGQINAFLTGVLKLMMTKKMITQQEMVEVYKSNK